MSHPREDPDDPDVISPLGEVVAREPEIGTLASPSYHTVTTERASELVATAQRLLALADGQVADGKPMVVDGKNVLPVMVLDRASNLLRLAAEAATDQRHLSLGWPEA